MSAWLALQETVPSDWRYLYCKEDSSTAASNSSSNSNKNKSKIILQKNNKNNNIDVAANNNSNNDDSAVDDGKYPKPKSPWRRMDLRPENDTTDCARSNSTDRLQFPYTYCPIITQNSTGNSLHTGYSHPTSARLAWGSVQARKKWLLYLIASLQKLFTSQHLHLFF